MNPKQTAFTKEYVQDHNATQAAIRAGYSPKTAGTQGQRLLQNVEIAKTIRELDADTAEGLHLTHEYVLNGLMNIATADPKSNVTGSAKVRAYELLGKHLGMFTDRLEITQLPSAALVEQWITALEDDLANLNR